MKALHCAITAALLSLATASTLAPTAAAAQPIWRCGADGRSYSDVPCSDGRIVATADPRSRDNAQAARGVLDRDRALLRELVQERHERERAAQAAGSGLAGIKPAADVKPARPPAALSPAHQRAKTKRQLAARGTSPAIVPASR